MTFNHAVVPGTWDRHLGYVLWIGKFGPVFFTWLCFRVRIYGSWMVCNVVVESGSGINHFGPQHCSKLCLNVYVWSYVQHVPNKYKERSSFLKNLPVKEFGGRCLSVWGPPPLCYTLYNYKYIPITYPCTFSQREGGGRSTSEKVRGALVHKRGRKYQHGWLYLQSINSIKHQ